MADDPCDHSTVHLANTRAIMVATVQGRDTGAIVTAHLLNSVSGYRVKNFAAGDGWVHLAEFGQRWLTMRKKMTEPDHADFPHFSQFLASPRDGIAPGVPDTDFRAMDELVRRKIKPAWLHFYNTSKLMCGLRQVIIETLNPSHHPVFGFVTALDASRSSGGDRPEDAPSRRAYSVGRALRSLDLFLQLFPRGQIILQLPVSMIPDDGAPPPRCICPGARAACKARGTEWPDRRVRLMRELTRYHERNPTRTLLTSASGDFRNMHQLVKRLSVFVGEASSSNLQHEADRSFRGWASRLRRDAILDLAYTQHTSAPWAANENPLATRPTQHCRSSMIESEVSRGALFWCAPFRCGLANTSAIEYSAMIEATHGGCTICRASLSEVAWGASKASAIDEVLPTRLVKSNWNAAAHSRRPKVSHSRSSSSMHRRAN